MRESTSRNLRSHEISISGWGRNFETFEWNGRIQLQIQTDRRGGITTTTSGKMPLRILIDSFADAGLPNAQMGNAREIACRLDCARFHVSMFASGEPDLRLVRRPNTRLIHLSKRRQTVKILREFLWGDHEILFYLKSSPASWSYMSLRSAWNDGRTVLGTMESQSDLR